MVLLLLPLLAVEQTLHENGHTRTTLELDQVGTGSATMMIWIVPVLVSVYVPAGIVAQSVEVDVDVDVVGARRGWCRHET